MNNLLPIALETSVTLLRTELIVNGKVPKVKLKEVSDLIAHHGDDLLYRSKKKGETAKIFNELAKAIVVMSCVPGGITLFGSHWETRFETLSDTAKDELRNIFGQKEEK